MQSLIVFLLTVIFLAVAANSVLLYSFGGSPSYVLAAFFVFAILPTALILTYHWWKTRHDA